MGIMTDNEVNRRGRGDMEYINRGGKEYIIYLRVLFT
jgi:hypothetical protein